MTSEVCVWMNHVRMEPHAFRIEQTTFACVLMVSWNHLLSCHQMMCSHLGLVLQKDPQLRLKVKIGLRL